MYGYLQKVISIKFLNKTSFFHILRVSDENNRIRIQDPDPNLDPLVRGMDPRIQIRIHTKMSWIRNTEVHKVYMHFRCHATLKISSVQ
jgi:hypothetical protein